MQVKNVGRPKKKNAVKPGQLAEGLMIFSFIAEIQLIKKIKASAKSEGLSMKDYMKKLLNEVTKEKEIITKVPIKILEKSLFTRNEAASILGVKARTVYSYQQKGILIPDKYINGRPRYSAETIEAIII
jgi:PP-loop superfamily ATP-utilizing enzyme